MTLERWRTSLGLITLVVLAGLLRVWAGSHVPVVSEDSAGGYLYQAQEILRGNWKEGMGTYFPPGLPLLVALLCHFGMNLESAAKLLSVACAMALVVAAFSYSRGFYGSWEAWVAAASMATYAPLVISCADAITEGPYTFLLAILCWEGYRTIREATAVRWLALGVLFGLEFLLRGEALLFLVLFLLLSLVSLFVDLNHRTTNYPWKRGFLGIVCLLIGFLTLALPYAIFLRSQTGTWQVSGKTMENLLAYDVDERGASVDYEEARMGLARDGQHLQMDLQKADSTLHFLWTNRARQVRKYIRNLKEVYIQALPRIVVPTYLALLAIGLFCSLTSKPDVLREAYFVAWFLLPFLFCPLFLIRERFLVPVLPVALLWASRGLVRLYLRLWELWSGEEPRCRRWRSWVFSGVLVLLVLSHQGPLATYLRADPSTFPLEHRRAGIWLKEHGRSHPRVMNRKSFVSFYAGGVPAVTPLGSYAAIVRYARAQCVDYFVVDERYTVPVRPELRFLLDDSKIPRELKKIYSDSHDPDAKISVFQVLSSDGEGSTE